jgi:SAM-dependent methyltransferase
MVYWIDVEDISFNSLLLLERVQLSWLAKINNIEKDLGIALNNNTVVLWYIINKCPEISGFITKAVSSVKDRQFSEEEIRESEKKVLNKINDWIVYVIKPKIYDQQPFLAWDSNELTDIANFKDKVVLDIGAGTGRLALVVAKEAKAVYAVEPVSNLRYYLKEKAKKLGIGNLYVVDGVIEDIPFESNFADIVMAGHVVGDDIKKEIDELRRVAKDAGQIVLCPGNSDKDNSIHDYLIEQGFSWGRFMQPRDGMKRKYWIEI